MSNKIKMANKSFTRKMFDACSTGNVLCGFSLLLYSVFLNNLSFSKYWMFILIVAALIIFAVYCVSSISTGLMYAKTNRMVKKWETVGLTQEERTYLFRRMFKMPIYKQIEAFTYFFSCAILFSVVLHFVLKINIYLNLVTFFANYFGAYVAALLSWSFTRRICSEYECKLVAEGLDPEIYEAKQIYGTTYKSYFIQYCIVPVVWTCVLFLSLIIVYYNYNIPGEAGYQKAMSLGLTKNQLPKLFVVLGLNCVLCAVSVYSFLHSILISSEQLQKSMTHILDNDIFSVKPNSTDYENEFTYNIGLVNDVVLLFRSVIEDIQRIGKTMIEPIDSLSKVSQSTATTSLEQSSGVKEILATMEETDAQTKSILNRISSVTDVAEETSVMVEEGSDALQKNLVKMDEITEANITTINGIRDLSEKIGNVWEIVKIINNIADQTRIIAFNAELEASSAGESGKNFHIVANEVRRLAAGITSSVDKIKERITEIQHSSDNLIITSESGTEKIREGQKLFEKLDERFGEIRKSSDFTVESAKQIKEFIYQQSGAFDQIVTTVRQISAGIDSFSDATNTVNETAKRLKEAADKLENLHNEIVKKDIA